MSKYRTRIGTTVNTELGSGLNAGLGLGLNTGLGLGLNPGLKGLILGVSERETIPLSFVYMTHRRCLQ